MLRVSTMIAICMMLLALGAQAALACDTCGCMDKAAGAACENCPNGGNCADCPKAGKCENCPKDGKCENCTAAAGKCQNCPKDGNCENCPKAQAGECAGCAKADGGKCAHCAQMTLASAPADAAAPAMTACEACAANPSGMCLDCTINGMVEMMPCIACGATGMCEHKAGMAARVHDAYAQLNASQEEFPGTGVAYMATTVSDDIEGTYGQLMGEAAGQGLVGMHSKVMSVYPDAMSKGYSTDTQLYCSISLADGQTVKDPLHAYDVPAGEYLVVDHVGPYLELDSSWMAAFAYAMQHGIEADMNGICFEEYVSDPETTPEAELLTKIFIPVVSATEMEG